MRHAVRAGAEPRFTERQPLPYASMTLEEIAALPVRELADQDGCRVFMWTTNRYLRHFGEIFAKRTEDRGDSTWFRWPRMGHSHSRKPEAFLDLVERVSPAPRLEMFARRNRLGWDTWGSESLEHVPILVSRQRERAAANGSPGSVQRSYDTA